MIEQTSEVPPTLEVRDLSVAYTVDRKSNTVVHSVSFDISPGEVLAVVGESGSGKSTTAHAVIGLLPTNGKVVAGTIKLNGTDITGWSPRRLEAVRGRHIGLVPQDPTSSLNPVQTIGTNLGEVLRIHRWGDKQAVRNKCLELLERVGIDDPKLRIDQYPFELSGGMRQRILIASAVALEPELIIADEPTSALDVTVQKRILDLLDELRRESETAILFVTHDLTIAAERSSRIIVLRDGVVQEFADTRTLLAQPTAEYTKSLLRDAPGFFSQSEKRVVGADGPSKVVVRNLVQEFGGGHKTPIFRAVDDVSFQVAEGTTHALVGESGSGKTTVARAVVGFRAPTSGEILVGDDDVAKLGRHERRRLRQRAQLVYQNPFESLDPLWTVERIIAEPLRNFGVGNKVERQGRMKEYLDLVALPQAVAERRPRELSGGQRQRVAITRALIIEPEVVVLDEAVSALDVTVQGQVLRLLDDLQGQLGVTYLFISHDLAVVRRIAHTVTVMERGRVVEDGPTEKLFANPEHPYTQNLIASIPRTDLVGS